MTLFVAGLGLIAVAAALYYVSRWNTRLAMAAATAELTTIGDLRNLYQRVSSEVGEGVFRQQIGLHGRIECDQPLKSELGGTACVAYRTRVERRWEEQVDVRDSDGKVRHETHSGSDVVASNERRVEFWLNDGSDRIPVNPEGARIDMEKVIDRFEPGDPGGLVRFGGFQLILAGGVPGRRRTLGYHYREDVLAVDRIVYVLGAADDANGTLGIAGIRDGSWPFVISRKSRAELVTSAKQTAAYTLYAACVCAPLGLVLVLVGLLRR